MDYIDLEAGQKVRLSFDPSTRTDTIGVFTAVDPGGNRTRKIWPEGVPPGASNFMTWSDKNDPIMTEIPSPTPSF